MAMDRSFIEKNRASTERIRSCVSKLSDMDLQHQVGEYWTVAIAFAHLAFWDKRVIFILDHTERERKLIAPEIDVLVNDISLSLWSAIPPRETVRLALETAQALDKQLEEYPQELLEQIYNQNKRWVLRNLHRVEHLDEIDEALKH
jgi:hypothetical protein